MTVVAEEVEGGWCTADLITRLLLVLLMTRPAVPAGVASATAAVTHRAVRAIADCVSRFILNVIDIEIYTCYLEKRNRSPLKWSKGNVEHPDRAGSQLPLNMLSVRYTPMPSSPCYMHVFTVRAATLLAEEEQTNPAGPSKYQLQPQPSQHQQQQRPTPPSNAAKQPRPASTSDAFGTVQQKKADSPETVTLKGASDDSRPTRFLFR